MPERRFPPPWTAEVTPNCFIVRDANGQALSYIYYESEPGRRSAAKLLSKDKERRIAAKYRAPGATAMSDSAGGHTLTREARRLAVGARGLHEPLLSRSCSQSTAAIFFAFRLEAPGCFFWRCASGG